MGRDSELHFPWSHVVPLIHFRWTYHFFVAEINCCRKRWHAKCYEPHYKCIGV